MEIPATPENRVLASAVNARIRAEARIQNAQAAFYRLAGAGTFCALVGAALGIALWGWAQTRGPAADAETVASAVAQAMSGLTLKTEGTVKLDPESRLAIGGGSEVPTPTAAQLGTGATPDSKAAVLTNFTVFKNVPFGSGQVVTGWNFTSSEQKSPQHQYCYYSEQLDGTSKVTVDLGENGRSLPQAKSRANLNPVTAYTNCVWFKGSI